MRVYYRVKRIYSLASSFAKYGGEIYATHKPQPTGRISRGYCIFETFYESKTEAENVIRTINGKTC